MDTQIACLTAPGKAAIATLAVRGPRAWPITRELFRPRKGKLPETPTPGRHWFGKLGKDHADDAILAVKGDGVELHCHGGVEVVCMIQELYAARGAIVVPWQQIGESLELLDLLVRAPTTRTAAILLDQWQGAWQRCMQEPSPDVLRRLADLIPLGRHLVEPWRIVIAGAPNVGKSSLMNALAGYARSIVAPTPGTTRDVVGVRLAIDGWPVEMIDTAGIRSSADALERQGIHRAEQAVRDADLRFWLLDGSVKTICPEDRALWHFIINKIDLPAAWDWEGEGAALRVSAQTHAGVPELCEWLSKRLVPAPPQPGEAVPCLQEHVKWLEAQG
jgi:tRNA modification GTPase